MSHTHQLGVESNLRRLSAVLLGGLLLGLVIGWLVPGSQNAGGEYVFALWQTGPFVALLGAIALGPVLGPRWWHTRYPEVALGIGGLALGCLLAGMPRATPSSGSLGLGTYAALHAASEYAGFMALVGGLYVVSGGVMVRVSARGTPLVNTALLACGAVLANLIGTTGASVLLIRPLMRINRGRLTALHVVFFIFIVSNCGGSLTPIGDPPLYLGYLKGVPFTWTLAHLWPNWLLVNGLLLGAFFAYDALAVRTIAPRPAQARRRAVLMVRGRAGVIGLVLMIAGVFVDPALSAATGIHAGGGGWPIGACVQIAVAAWVYTRTPASLLRANGFTFEPVREVGLLFFGIFAAMVPALGYLAQHGPALGLRGPGDYYWATGVLSAVLDNAPTYLNFVQVAMAPAPVGPRAIEQLLATDAGHALLDAISSGAVFFGAMTYIGNGPNFMVKSIAQSAGVRMPGFFGYVGWGIVILLPVLAVNWLVLIR